ncbi:MAG: nucleotidyltransferase domain-containing protein [Chloroflexi bacterium]|nr:nucleotidyltransferase domain-containing protein [Chloroflexota bacterium]
MSVHTRPTRERPVLPQRVTRRQIRATVKRIASEFAPKRIILFGSYAYGRPRPDSDVDLLIVMELPIPAREQRRLISRALSPHPFGLDLLVKTPTELTERITSGDWFLREIVQRGKVMYEQADA